MIGHEFGDFTLRTVTFNKRFSFLTPKTAAGKFPAAKRPKFQP